MVSDINSAMALIETIINIIVVTSVLSAIFKLKTIDKTLKEVLAAIKMADYNRRKEFKELAAPSEA